MSADWKTIVKSIAPTIGTALGGPLAGTAVKVLGNILLGNEDAGHTEVEQAILNGLPPDIIAKLKEADQAFAVRMKELDIDLAKLNASTEVAYLQDVQSARATMGRDSGVYWLGITILLVFAGVMGAVLWGSFAILTGGITIKDVAVVATVSGLVGTVVGYVAANAQQVVGYFYGSSQGSKAKTDALAEAVTKAASASAQGR